MDSRLLSNLNAQAGSTRDPVVWATAVCRAASHFAGHGKTDDALTAISVVRGQFGKNLHFDIASWLMLAEGVLHFFRAEFPQSYDRIRRAYGLAIALGNSSAFPSCAAWMAHVEFNAGKYDDMAKHVEEALTTAKQTDRQAIARASLVLATAYHIAGEFELSRPWYERARLNAAAEGDDATVSATLHNMASIRAANIRLDDTFGGDPTTETKRVTLEASSSYTYDQVIGHRAMDFLTTMLTGLISTIDKRYEDGLKSLGSIDLNLTHKRYHPLILIDQAWCLSQMGDTGASWEIACRLPAMLSVIEDDDDLAYINSRLHQISLACGHLETAASFKEIADAALVRHRLFQGQLLQKLHNIKTGIQNKNPA